MSAAPHLAHNVESMPEQQVVIPVNASLRQWNELESHTAPVQCGRVAHPQ